MITSRRSQAAQTQQQVRKVFYKWTVKLKFALSTTNAFVLVFSEQCLYTIAVIQTMYISLRNNKQYMYTLHME